MDFYYSCSLHLWISRQRSNYLKEKLKDREAQIWHLEKENSFTKEQASGKALFNSLSQTKVIDVYILPKIINTNHTVYRSSSFWLAESSAISSKITLQKVDIECKYWNHAPDWLVLLPPTVSWPIRIKVATRALQRRRESKAEKFPRASCRNLNSKVSDLPFTNYKVHKFLHYDLLRSKCNFNRNHSAKMWKP